MRWLLLLGCAIWAVGCAEDAIGPSAFHATSSSGATAKKKTSTTANDSADDDTAPASSETEPTVAAPVESADGEPRLIEHIVKPSDADPTVKDANEQHYVYFDTRAKVQDKLVLYLGGANVRPIKEVPMLKEIASYGFRVVGLRYQNDFIVQNICNSHPNDADCQGKLRREVIEGTDLSPWVNVPKEDGIDTRLTKVLSYLDEQAPNEGWGKYLTDPVNGAAPIWTNIIVAGHSSGSSTAGRMSKLRELGGVLMLSGPNDNLNDVPSKWMSEPARTPVQRIWAFSDTDDAQYPQHKKGWTAMGLLGPATSIDGLQAPFNNAHRLTTSKPGGGHNSTNQGNGDYTAVWRYALGL